MLGVVIQRWKTKTKIIFAEVCPTKVLFLFIHFLLNTHTQIGKLKDKFCGTESSHSHADGRRKRKTKCDRITKRKRKKKEDFWHKVLTDSSIYDIILFIFSIAK